MEKHGETLTAGRFSR